ncbi:hypothetical protein BGY98DRAFT_1002940, partial [Russula aff. rugulosa BPL654]
MSSPAFNFVAMSSYDHFCFLQHIQTCYFYAQNLPTIVTLLPRAGLALAPENFPGGLSLSGVDQSIGGRDGTFFDKNREL